MGQCVCVWWGGPERAHIGAMKGDGSVVRVLALLDHQSAFIFLEDFTPCTKQEHELYRAPI